MKGEALKILQRKVGAAPDGAFGPNTARAIAAAYAMTPAEGAHVLGQGCVESGGFQITVENLNYSSEAMMRVWPSRFPSIGSTAPYERNPEALANNVYSGRMGNGDEASGDGFKFRGRGFIQLTGRNNYTAFSRAINRPSLLDDPSPVATNYAFIVLLWFFETNGLDTLAQRGVDDDTIRLMTRRINGGYTHLKERGQWTKKIHRWLTS